MQARRYPIALSIHLLTNRQGDVLALLLEGLSNKRIALALGIAESTVKEHVSAILDRLGARSRVEVITALQSRQVPSPNGTSWRPSF